MRWICDLVSSLALTLLAALVVACSTAAPPRIAHASSAADARRVAVPSDHFDSVVLDPGHGGDDEGARSPRGLLEKDLVLDVAERLGGRLERRGLAVVYTRRGDQTVSLEQRTSIANDARADLFLSIHANAARSDAPRGFEIYFVSLEASDESARRVAELENRAFGEAGRSAAVHSDPVLAVLGDLALTDYMRESNDFARLAHQELMTIDDAESRGVRQAPFVVLMGPQMPSSLVEIGFITNPAEEKRLRQSKRRDAIARALERAVLHFGKRYDARRGLSSR